MLHKALLSLHTQDCVAIWWPEIKLHQNEVHGIDFEYERGLVSDKIPGLNGLMFTETQWLHNTFE